MLQIEPHPSLDVRAFVARFKAPLQQLASPPELLDLLRLDTDAPLARTDEIRAAVRDVLRSSSFKPTGRSKPASEFLIKAATNEILGAINLAVDACNAVSLNSGLPISVLDLSQAEPPLCIAIGEPGMEYVFNHSGQTIDLKGLLCVHDAHGPCGNAVKDSQRTKTSPDTTETLSIIWSSKQIPERTQAAYEWYVEILSPFATIERIA